uniref:Uncharacterized protein n=1 Tax=Arundo donax TaxID=35708 RepID=A0A0A8ZZM9_ARUDO
MFLTHLSCPFATIIFDKTAR